MRTDAAPTRMMILGHSHTNCIVEALTARDAPAPEWRALQLKRWQGRLRRSDRSLDPQAISARTDQEIARIIGKLAGHPGRLSPKALPEFVVQHDIATVMGLRGAQYVIKGLLASDPPFDFVLPAAPDLPVDETAVLLPYNAVKTRYDKIMEGTMAQLEHFSRLIQNNLYHIEMPPPYGDDGYLADHLGGYFAEAMEGEVVFANKWLRYKLWRLCSDIYRRRCEDLGIQFVPIPDGVTVDAFLSPEAYHADAIHANRWYGDKYVSELEDAVRARLPERASQ